MTSRTKLLAAIGTLVVALGVIVFLIFRNSTDENTTLTAEQLSRYEQGIFYRTTITSTVQGRIEDKDWGLDKKVTLVHEGEIDFIREIKSVNSDHSEVVVGLEILSARDLEARLSLDDAVLDLPPAIGILGKTARKFLFTGPSGIAASIAVDRTAEWLRSDENRTKVLSRLNAAVEFTTGKGIEEHLLSAKLQPLEAYEGLTADYTYEAGKGLTHFETQATLSNEQEARVKDFSVYSEAYLLPDPRTNGPKQWDVDVKNIAHLLAPTQDLDVSGTLTFERGETENSIVELNISKGKVVFSGSNDTTQVLGTWAARGSLYYDTAHHNITRGELSGAVSMERRSTDHVLFEEKFEAAPSYRVVISGFATRDETEARRPVENVTTNQ
ncbi:hypothetical protein V2O64_18150 [Verrucomicrobiaceae bacterium 227]